MHAHELPIAIDWAAGEGWNPGTHDATAFYAADSGGFLLGEVDGEPVASVSAVCYGSEFAFVGFYIVKPEHRGKGYGMAVWRAALERARACANVGLDGVLAQVANYERSGFALDYCNVRYRGAGGGEPTEATPIDAAMLDEVADYDARCFPAPREAFVRAWVSAPNAVSRCVVREGRVAGYAVMRRCREGWKIGPLFADDARTAKRLFDSLRCRALPDELVYLDVPSVHDGAVAIARDAKMTPVFETARMYVRGRPHFAFERCFGVTSFELG